MMPCDFLIVGSGLTGAVTARRLHDAGFKVLVLERRPHLGGNVFDHHHPSGIRVHSYGPHYFRTSSEGVWSFVTRFASFYEYGAIVKSLVDGGYENWPVNRDYLKRECGAEWQPAFYGAPSNFEEASLAMMPAWVYEKFVKEYSEKQWGVPARSLAVGLAKRFEVREGCDCRLKCSRYQGLPEKGYCEWIKSLMRGIPAIVNVDYLRYRRFFAAKYLVVYTGPIDEYFDFRLGRLAWRGQRRVEEYSADADYLLPCGQVNNPSKRTGDHIRIIEWKHMMPPGYAEGIFGTVLTKEYPYTPSDPDKFEYPFPDAENRARYREYREMAAREPGVIICGRLGEYTYIDMDQAISCAMQLSEALATLGAVQETADRVGQASRQVSRIQELLSRRSEEKSVIQDLHRGEPLLPAG